MPTTSRNTTKKRASTRRTTRKSPKTTTTSKRRATNATKNNSTKKASKATTPNFGTPFKAAVKRGTPATTAVWNIAKKHNKTEQFVWNWLEKNGFVNSRSINGTKVFWPSFSFNTQKTSSSQLKPFTIQQFVNWAIVNGYCTPEQVSALKSQKDFFNFFGQFFASQFNFNVTGAWTTKQVKAFNNTTNSTGSNNAKSTSKRSRKGTSKRSTRNATSRKRASSTTTARKSSGRKSARQSTKRTTASTTNTRNYKFPTSRTSTPRRTRKAA